MLLLVVSIQLNAQNSTRDPEKEGKIENQLAAIDPSLVAIFKAGTEAMDQDDLALADSLYSLVYQKAPTFDVILRRLGGIWFRLGKTQEGIALCEKAIEINRSGYNLLSLANCYFQPNPGTQDLSKAKKLAEEGEFLSNGDDPDFATLLGWIALEEENIDEFRSATSRLMQKYPDEMVSHYFAAILASADGEWKKAKNEILIAKEKGLPEESVQKFLDSGVQSKLRPQEYATYFLWMVIAWMVGLLLLFLVGKLLSNITLLSVERHDHSIEMTRMEQIIRSFYRYLINIGGVYYYISLPIILVLVVALVAGLFYVFFLVGRLPIQLMLILLVGSLVTIYSMIRSLLIRVKYTDPGRELNEAEAPGLFKLAKEVAQTMNTRPIDEIRITATTDLAVYERGKWKEKLKDQAKRILILGVGVLKDFKQNDFKAVLAHEYGHFSHRDTAGGDVALRVRNDMTKYFYELYLAGQNVWWNIAFQFLRLYNLIFVRISHGATRLQEVLADRVAAQTYGARAFQDGLTYVIKRDIEFMKYANSEIEEARKIDRPFNNLYELSGNADRDIEEELKEALNKETSENDTHPSPVDRFRYVDGINTKTFPEDASLVKELFTDWESLTTEMTTQLEERVKQG